MTKNNYYLPRERKNSRTSVYVFVGIFAFVLIFFPLFGVKLRFQLGLFISKYHTISKYLGHSLNTITGFSSQNLNLLPEITPMMVRGMMSFFSLLGCLLFTTFVFAWILSEEIKLKGQISPLIFSLTLIILGGFLSDFEYLRYFLTRSVSVSVIFIIYY